MSLVVTRIPDRTLEKAIPLLIGAEGRNDIQFETLTSRMGAEPDKPPIEYVRDADALLWVPKTENGNWYETLELAGFTRPRVLISNQRSGNYDFLRRGACATNLFVLSSGLEYRQVYKALKGEE